MKIVGAQFRTCLKCGKPEKILWMNTGHSFAFHYCVTLRGSLS